MPCSPGKLRLTVMEVASAVASVVIEVVASAVIEVEGAAVEVFQEEVGALREVEGAAQDLVSEVERKL